MAYHYVFALLCQIGNAAPCQLISSSPTPSQDTWETREVCDAAAARLAGRFYDNLYPAKTKKKDPGPGFKFYVGCVSKAQKFDAQTDRDEVARRLIGAPRDGRREDANG